MPKILTILRHPNPVLKRKCVPVPVRYEQKLPTDPVDFVDKDQIKELADDMIHTMFIMGGVGLSAPQIGQSLRMFVCSHDGDQRNALVFINPTILDQSNPIDTEEGCLSLPDVRVNMRRSSYVKIHAYRPDGSAFEMSEAGFRPVIWQHEIDHLDGRLIVDQMSEADKIRNRHTLNLLLGKRRSNRRTIRNPKKVAS